MDSDDINFAYEHLHRIPEESWRMVSREHSQQIREMLSPGLTPLDHPMNTGLRRQQRQWERKERRRILRNQQPSGETNASDGTIKEPITALDPRHPVYNFLIEYYGLKGTKGVRRLLKWSPGMHDSTVAGTQPQKVQRGILLEGATEQDFFTSLHTKGAALYDNGVVYYPLKFVYGRNDHHPIVADDLVRNDATHPIRSSLPPDQDDGPLAPFLWYQLLLKQTLEATPILHCYGLHEWAMQYQPTIAKDHESRAPKLPLPPSSKYQSHLRLRIDQETLNKTVEMNTLLCSHVDAWKYFAKDALPLNQFVDRKLSNKNHVNGIPPAEDRPGWLLQSEQPACVHTTMDLLKIALKLGPFCEPRLFRRILSITIEARNLDVAASPYDAKTRYGVEPIRIETPSGKSEYKRRQMEVMKLANPVRKELLKNYEKFLSALR